MGKDRGEEINSEIYQKKFMMYTVGCGKQIR